MIRIFSSWNATVKNIFKLPMTTHRFLIESVSNCAHPKTMMFTRYLRFQETMKSCSRLCVRFLVNLVSDDRRTLMGRTLDKMSEECLVSRELLSSSVARNVRYFSPPPEEEWRIPLLAELLDARDGRAEIMGTDAADVEFMINEVCTS